MPRLRLFAILCFDSQERREAPRLVYRLDTRGAGLYRRQPVTVPPVPCHLRFTRQRHPPRQVTLPPPDPFCHSPSQRVVEVAALDQWLAMLYPRVEHQAVLAVVVVVVGPLVVHPYHPFRDAVRLLRQPAVFIVAVDIVRIFRDAVTGSDPRGLPEFSAIREEINKASHPSQPELNWKLVESLALAIFKANGVDLHTATYYTLARTRTQGLAGFCEGAELLAAMVSHDWDKFWPQGGPARTEMLDWFNSRTGNILRQQISFAESDLPLIYRTERALQLICDKLQQVELKRVPRVENLLYFMQNTRKRLEPQLKSNTENAAQTTVRTLIYAPETQASSTPEAVVPPLAAAEE